MLSVFEQVVVLTSKVAAIKFDENVAESFKQALRLIGGIDDLNTAKRSHAKQIINHKQNTLGKSVLKDFAYE